MTLLHIAEAARLLDVRVGRVYEMARHGLLPVVRLGRQVRVHPAQLDAWMESGGKALASGWRNDARGARS